MEPCSALPATEMGTATRKTQDQGDPVFSPRQAEGSSLKERSEWRQAHAQGGRTPSLPTSPSRVPLYDRYEALDVEGQSMDDVDDGPSPPEVLPRSERPSPCITTTSTRKKRWVIVVGDSLLRGAEGRTCRTGPPLREPAASLGPGLRTSPGNFLAWYGPQTVTHYCSSTWLAMKLQRVVQGQSRETSGPWDGW